MKKILIIEDDAFIRANIADLLEIEGYLPIEAENGKIGIAKALENQADIILCDVMMPEMDGYQVLKNVRQEKRLSTTPFIFLTAKAGKVDLRYGMEHGADDYLVKPFTRSELLKAISAKLEKKATLHQHAEQQLEALRTNISYALPHELLTPLNGIIGSADILKNDIDALSREDITEFADMIHSSAIRMHRLVQNFLLYSRLEVIASNPAAAQLLKGDITHSAASGIREVIERICSGKGRFEDVIFESDDCGVRISELYFDKILEELIDNALKFSLPGTPVDIRCFEKGDFACIEITDRGRGLAQDQIANLGAYMQFNRKQHEQQGAGLGLIIVKRLIELHDGEWSVESSPDEFTKISLSLPVSKHEDF